MTLGLQLDRHNSIGRSVLPTSNTHIPLTLVAAVELFKQEMGALERDLLGREEHLGDSEGQRVHAACEAIVYALRSHVAQQPERETSFGEYVARETRGHFTRSHLTHRSVTKPRGYAGDYYTIELVYDDIPSGDGPLGRLIDAWFLQLHASRAVKNRRSFLGAAIASIVAERALHGCTAKITSLASGPAREVFDLLRDPAKRPPHFEMTCIDMDDEALKYVAERAAAHDMAETFRVVRANVVRLCRKKEAIVEPQDLIYSSGLVDYLRDDHVVPLLDWVHDSLAPGGTAIIGSFAPSNPDKVFMDHILNWRLIYRSPTDMRRLFKRSKFGSRGVDVQFEQTGVNLFAFCEK